MASSGLEWLARRWVLCFPITFRNGNISRCCCGNRCTLLLRYWGVWKRDFHLPFNQPYFFTIKWTSLIIAFKCILLYRDILKRKGTVADAAIATALCVGVIQSQSMGLGGGFLLVYYDAASKTARVSLKKHNILFCWVKSCCYLYLAIHVDIKRPRKSSS